MSVKRFVNLVFADISNTNIVYIDFIPCKNLEKIVYDFKQ